MEDDEFDFSCELCPFSCQSFHELEFHVQTVHQEYIEEQEDLDLKNALEKSRLTMAAVPSLPVKNKNNQQDNVKQDRLKPAHNGILSGSGSSRPHHVQAQRLQQNEQDAIVMLLDPKRRMSSFDIKELLMSHDLSVETEFEGHTLLGLLGMLRHLHPIYLSIYPLIYLSIYLSIHLFI